MRKPRRTQGGSKQSRCVQKHGRPKFSAAMERHSIYALFVFAPVFHSSYYSSSGSENRLWQNSPNVQNLSHACLDNATVRQSSPWSEVGRVPRSLSIGIIHPLRRRAALSTKLDLFAVVAFCTRVESVCFCKIFFRKFSSYSLSLSVFVNFQCFISMRCKLSFLLKF